MSAQDDLITMGVVGAIAIGGLWYLKKKVGAVAKQTGAYISDGASWAWNTATTPVLDLGTGAVGSTVASIGNGIVSAPANALDSLSLGLIGGSGGNTGNGGLGGFLTGIVDGSYFAPAGATDPAPIDMGTGANDWSS